METSRPVIVKRMPAKLNHAGARDFFRDVTPLLDSDRPQMVFDLSQVKHMGVAGVEMLLDCMRRVMKRDGDLKLASPSPEAVIVLELTRTDRLFEIYDSSTDAVRSFSCFLPNTLRAKDPAPAQIAA